MSSGRPAAKRARTEAHSTSQPRARALSPITLSGDDEDDEAPFEYESDADSAGAVDTDTDLGAGDGAAAQAGGRGEFIIIDDTDEDDGNTQTPPEPVIKPAPKGKLTSRRQFVHDLEALGEQFSSTSQGTVRGFRRDGDEQVRFTLHHGSLQRDLPLAVLVPELAGYPASHDLMVMSEECENSHEVQQVFEEIHLLPRGEADRSLAGVIEYLILRLVHKKPSPYAAAATGALSDDEPMDEFDDDYLFGLGATAGVTSAMKSALRSDFKEIVKAGFMPGFTRVSETDNVVSVSKKVNDLNIPVDALQAWDSELITGEPVYLVLLMSFKMYPVDVDNGTRGEPRFKMGISPKYKPSHNAVAAAFRTQSANTYTAGDFQAISLSAPFDALMLEHFQSVLRTRGQNDKCGWAAAEQHCATPVGQKADLDSKAARKADKEEEKLAGTYGLPFDPMGSTSTRDNFPLLAFSFLLRRFIMCPRYCLVCARNVDQEITALKPFVCSSELCLWQAISVGLGPSLEHEIKTNAPAVDLLIQLAWSAAKENRLSREQQPVGLSLEVPQPKLGETWKAGDPTADFDGLDTFGRNAGIAALIMELPPVAEMKAWLAGEGLTDEERLLNRDRKLTDIRNGTVVSSAWRLLRWIVASNLAYLKQVEEEDELIQNIPKAFRQFKLVVGSPSKEHQLRKAIVDVQARNENARKYPTLYAWHGSAVKNWHSILREGLHFNETINGRAYGHGCYFAREGETSLYSYAPPSSLPWPGAEFPVSRAVALVELVNMPSEFVSNQPYFVVNQLPWIQCRYLIILRNAAPGAAAVGLNSAADEPLVEAKAGLTKSIPLDPAFPPTLKNKKIAVPDIKPKLEAMTRRIADHAEDLNDSDVELMKEPPVSSSPGKGKNVLRGSSSASRVVKPKEPFEPASAERLQLVRVLPPTSNPNRGAMAMIQREMKAMLKSQETLGPVEAGFYYDPERSNDNAFDWIVELMGFDPELPLAKDMKAKGVKSLLFEIRFGEAYPNTPPFFRLVHPRLLPFAQGGGGHITAGGSVCSDLLTSDGWSPAYQIEAVLMQIRLAISNLDPKPARLDRNWNTPYSMTEAVEGFRRTASRYGWKVPPDLNELTRNA